VTNIGLNLEYTPGVSDRSAMSELSSAVPSPTEYAPQLQRNEVREFALFTQKKP